MTNTGRIILFAGLCFLIGVFSAIISKRPHTPVGYNDPFYFDDTEKSVLEINTTLADDSGKLFCDTYDSLCHALSDSGIQVYYFNVGDTIIHTVNK